MTIPDDDLAEIQRFCAAQTPPEFADQLRVEARVSGDTVTIVQCRPSWGPSSGDDWIEVPEARMTYDPARNAWTLYCFDSDERAHRYDLLDPQQPLAVVLAEYDADPTGIFKG